MFIDPISMSRNESVEMVLTRPSSQLDRRRFVSMLVALGGFAVATRALGHAFESCTFHGSITRAC